MDLKKKTSEGMESETTPVLPVFPITAARAVRESVEPGVYDRKAPISCITLALIPLPRRRCFENVSETGAS